MFLAIDSTDRGGSIALARDGRLLDLVYEDSQRTHTARLMPTIERLLSDRDVEFKALNKIAVATGPGSFTAIRLAVTTAKTLAEVCGASLAGISSLRVLAEYGRGHDGVIRSVIDARRGELYVRDFEPNNGELAPLGPAEIQAPETFVEVSAELSSPLVVYRSRAWDPAGYDWPANTSFYPETLARPLAVPLVSLGTQRFDSGDADDPDRLAPNYIRESDARRSSSDKTKKEPAP